MHKLLVFAVPKWVVGMNWEWLGWALKEWSLCRTWSLFSTFLFSWWAWPYPLRVWWDLIFFYSLWLHQGLTQISCQAAQFQSRELCTRPCSLGCLGSPVLFLDPGSSSSIGLTGTLPGVSLPGDVQRVWNIRVEPGSHCCGALCNRVERLLRSNQLLLRSFATFLQNLTLGQGKNNFNQQLHSLRNFLWHQLSTGCRKPEWQSCLNPRAH